MNENLQFALRRMDRIWWIYPFALLLGFLLGPNPGILLLAGVAITTAFYCCVKLATPSILAFYLASGSIVLLLIVWLIA